MSKLLTFEEIIALDPDIKEMHLSIKELLGGWLPSVLKVYRDIETHQNSLDLWTKIESHRTFFMEPKQFYRNIMDAKFKNEFLERLSDES